MSSSKDEDSMELSIKQYMIKTKLKAEEESKKYPSRRNVQRKVKFDGWREPALVSKLIALVAQRTVLWDSSAAASQISKESLWREVAQKMAVGIHWEEVKIKWMHLRVTFRANLSKLRQKAYNEGIDVSEANVVWRHFNEMKFLLGAATNVEEAYESTSSLTLKSAEPAILEAHSPSSTPSPMLVPMDDPLEHKRTSTRKASTPRKTPSPAPSAMHSSPSSTASLPEPKTVDNPSRTLIGATRKSTRSTPSHSSNRELAPQALTKMVPPLRRDQHTTFGEYIASESRIMSTGESDELRERICRTLFDYKAELRHAKSTDAHRRHSSNPTRPTRFQTPSRCRCQASPYGHRDFDH